MLLRVQSNDKRWDVDDLLSNSNVSLTDEHSGVVDRLGEARLVDLCLETSFEEILNLESQDVIESGRSKRRGVSMVEKLKVEVKCSPHAGLVQNPNSNQSSDNGVTLKQSLGVLFIQLQQLSSSTSDLGDCQRDSPQFSLVLETIFSGQFEF